MPIAQGQCTIFKQNLLNGLENFSATSPYVYKMALYNNTANLNNTTTAYTPVGEVSGSGYTAGGNVITPLTPSSDTSNNTAYLSFNNVTWPSSGFTANGALVYNSTTNAAIFVLYFGGDKTSPNFTVTFPTDTSTTAVILIQ
jgi:hypothetical protein